VREALSALQAMGLIDLKQGEGTFVRKLASKDLLEVNYSSLLIEHRHIESLLEVRKIIETSAVGLAAKRRTYEDLVGLEDALSLMEKDIYNEEHGQKADWLFHYSIARATKNEMLVYIIESISDSMKRNLITNRAVLFQREGMPEKLLEEHKKIYRAIEKQDVELAKELLFNHLHQVEINIKEILENK